MNSFYDQINGDEPLISCSDLQDLHVEDGYSIVPLVHSSWQTAPKRLLVLVETVDSLDLHRGELLSGDTNDTAKRSKDTRSEHNPMRSVLSNILDISRKLLKPYGIQVDGDFAFGIANYNAKKIRNLELAQQLQYFPEFTKRAYEIIKRLKPTHVLVCGDTASHYLLERLKPADEDTPEHLCPPQVAEHSEYKRGWVFHRRIGSHKFWMVPTLDIESLYNPARTRVEEDEDDDENVDSDKYAAADLLFFVARNIANLFNEKMLHSIADILPNPYYVDTIEKFDEF